MDTEVEIQSDPQNAVLNWAAGASRHDRLDFLKDFLKVLSNDELKQVKTLASHQKRNSYKRKLTEETSVASVPASAASVPTDVAAQKKQKIFWFHTWKKEDIISLDVEKVSVEKKGKDSGKVETTKKGKKKYVQKAAEVTLTDHTGKMIYTKKIRHAEGSFLVNRSTIAVNGFRKNSLVKGEVYDVVHAELMDILKGKLVITCGGEEDFKSLGLSSTQFDHFDIQWYWYEEKISSKGVIYEEPHGLRNIYYHYYKEDIQHGVHDAFIDAAATMRLFQEKYIPECIEKNIDTMMRSEPSEENIQRLPKIIH